MENIIKSIRRHYPVSDESLNLLLSGLKPIEFPAKSTIVKAGVLDKSIYFIEKGISRSYVLVGDKESTTWFSREGDLTFGSLDFYRNKAGFEYVETLEKTLVYSISIEKLNNLYKTNIEISNWGRIVIQETLLLMQDLRIERLNLSAKERYQKFLNDFPDICKRVNLGYIASYLGITLPTLSKLRSEY